MHRSYRRPGIARAADDGFGLRQERSSRSPRPTPRVASERLSKMINQLIAQAALDDFAEAPEDRRMALRQPADERPFEARAEGQDAGPVWLEDVSRTGMRFRSQQAFACGDVVTLSAAPSFDLKPIAMRIVRVQMVDSLIAERGFEYGAEYVVMDEQPHKWYLATRARY